MPHNKPQDSVRCKFKCTFNSKVPDNDRAESYVSFEAVIDGSEENKLFFSYTPSGQLSIGVVSPAVAAKFIVGKEYYLDFTPCEESVAE